MRMNSCVIFGPFCFDVKMSTYFHRIKDCNRLEMLVTFFLHFYVFDDSFLLEAMISSQSN